MKRSKTPRYLPETFKAVAILVGLAIAYPSVSPKIGALLIGLCVILALYQNFVKESSLISKRNKIVVLVLMVVLLAMLALNYLSKPFLYRARQSECRSMVSSFFGAQKSYFQEFHQYAAGPDVFRQVGYRPQGTGVRIYVDQAEVPGQLLVLLSKDEYPYSRADGFQVLVVIGRDTPEIACLIDQDRKVKFINLAAIGDPAGG